MKYSKHAFKYLVEENFSVKTPIRSSREIDTWYCTLSPEGVLMVKRGFASDGASGWTFDTDATKQPAVEHDIFYKLMRKKLVGISWKPIIDVFFRDRLVEEGMSKCRADMWLIMVDAYGWKAATKPSKIYTTKHHVTL